MIDTGTYEIFTAIDKAFTYISFIMAFICTLAFIVTHMIVYLILAIIMSIMFLLCLKSYSEHKDFIIRVNKCNEELELIDRISSSSKNPDDFIKRHNEAMKRFNKEV